jgi:hypothetical protein
MNQSMNQNILNKPTIAFALGFVVALVICHFTGMVKWATPTVEKWTAEDQWSCEAGCNNRYPWYARGKAEERKECKRACKR